MNQIDFIGKKAALLSLVEVGLGSFIHGFKIPLGGNFLSLYQTFFMTKTAIESKPLGLEKKSPYLVSTIAGVLKSLSPAGNKLGPMLSISAQGTLFSFGTFCFGPNILGHIVGGILAGLWAFCQPILTYFVFFGPNLFKALDYFVKKTFPFNPQILPKLVLGIIGAKILLSVLAVWAAHRFRLNTKIISFEERLLALGTKVKQIENETHSQALWGALKDLTRPLFLASLALTGFFFYYTQYEGGRIWITLLRPLALGFIFFYFSRSLLVIDLVAKLEKTSLAPWAQSLRVALEHVRGTGNPEADRI